MGFSQHQKLHLSEEARGFPWWGWEVGGFSFAMEEIEIWAKKLCRGAPTAAVTHKWLWARWQCGGCCWV